MKTYWVPVEIVFFLLAMIILIDFQFLIVKIDPEVAILEGILLWFRAGLEQSYV